MAGETLMVGPWLVIDPAEGRVMADCTTLADAMLGVGALGEAGTPCIVAHIAHDTDANIARNYVPEKEPAPCGDDLVALSLGDRVALVAAGRALAELDTAALRGTEG